MRKRKIKFKRINKGVYFAALGEIYETKNGFFETDDEKLIEFLRKSKDFKEIKDEKDADTKEE